MSTPRHATRHAPRHATRHAICAAIACLATSLPGNASAQTIGEGPDYASQLPRTAPQSVADAGKLFRLLDGFRIELIASEPLVADPIAMAFDESGRLFVVEMRGYSEDPHLNIGRIRLLTDRDGDGRFDDATTYVDGLSWPTAIACFDGGVFVGAAPNITYHKDSDGDGKADLHETVFRGFGRSNVQGLLNSFNWSLDHRIFGATSSTGAELAGASLPSGNLTLRSRDFAFDPWHRKIEAVSGGGQHGMSFNAWGERFVCSNSDHIQFITYEDRYVKRNPYFAPAPARVSIASDGPQADVYRTSPVEPWRILRTRLRVDGQVPGPIEGGGTPAGYFTGATGITVYRGNAWPDKFAGWAFVCDVGSNLIHRKRLVSQGTIYRADRVDENKEFLTSSDIWFRPVQLANGPDGVLYVADMYREFIEHPKSLPPMIKRHLDLTSGRDRGRIYRIVPPKFQQPPQVRLGEATTARLVATLDHPNGWHRETAARLLYERGWADAKTDLTEMARSGQRPEGRIRALYGLAGAGELAPDTIKDALRDTHPQVRRHAVRLSEAMANQPQVRDQLLKMSTDPSIVVRYQLAFTCGELESHERFKTLAEIARLDSADAHARTAIQSSLVNGSGRILTQLVDHPSWCETDHGKLLLKSLAAQIGRQQNRDQIQTLVTLQEQQPSIVSWILVNLQPRPGSKLDLEMSHGRLAHTVKGVVDWARATVDDARLPLAARVSAVHALRLSPLAAEAETFQKLLTPSQPLPIQRSALATLTSFADSDVADLLIERWNQLSPQVREQASDRLLSRPSWQTQLLEAIEARRVQTGDVDFDKWRLLLKKDSPLAARIEQVVKGHAAPEDRQDIYQRYQSEVTQDGNIDRGREVFRKHCATCHQLEGSGHPIGPNLAAMKNRGAQAILLNVLMPNQEVNPQYVTYVATTRDGRVISGMITQENATSITLRREKNEFDTILRVDLDELTSTGRSLMPENFETEINPKAMSDLLTYVLSIAP